MLQAAGSLSRDGGQGEAELGEELARLTGHAPLAPVVNHWALILASRGIPYRLSQPGDHACLYVPSRWRTLALQELTAEPCDGALSRPAPPVSRPPDIQTTLLLFLGLFLFHGIVHGWWFGILPPETWIARGGLDAARVWSGHEWCRVVTALTLHADSAHIFGNVAFGSVILAMLCRRIGTGLGWFAAVAAGALGNAAMLLVRADQYVSIGFSTAIFGAMGTLCTVAVMSSERQGWRRLVIPIAAGLAWLGFLGGGSESAYETREKPEFLMPVPDTHTDIGAHGMGFMAGLALGALIGAYCARRGPPGAKTGALWGIVALAAVIVCWGFALKAYAG